ncbi:mercuric reductase [Synechococcus elongatus]|uniref:mercuric reductase n=1 Tax=Synechococcus elongatus TaxID=32046 RepID=UPI0030CD38F8
MMSGPQSVTDLISPSDAHNQFLIDQVSPQNWTNPIPPKSYDLVVIGAGPAGLVVAAGAAGLGIGLKIALIEKHLMGGDCLNFGCVPSKTFIRAARVIGELRKSKKLGIQIPEDAIAIDFAAVMERVRQVRAAMSIHDSAERFKDLGVDVFFGQAQFSDCQTVQVGDSALSFRKAVISTGAHAKHPAISGLQSVGFLTNETVFSLTDCPRRLAVIGGGPIGCELAQAFQRLGSQVTLFHRGPQLLNKEDPEVAKAIQQQLTTEGVRLILAAQIDRVEKDGQEKIIYYRQDGQDSCIQVDQILVGTGRSPNVQGLNLEVAGVDYEVNRGVFVNDYLQTSNPKIYAAGDICLDWKFTHTADAAARIVLKNALFSPLGLGRSKVSNLIVPRVTFTDPEVAHVGLSVRSAQQQGIAIATITIPFSQVDRAIVDEETEGFIKIHHQPNSDRILGATMVAPHAGEIISEISTAIAHGLGLSALSGVIHPYPTQAESIKKAADTYRRTLLTPTTKRLLRFLQWFS